jgi:hypothetical protein
MKSIERKLNKELLGYNTNKKLYYKTEHYRIQMENIEYKWKI